jgi:hypothetical protein
MIRLLIGIAAALGVHELCRKKRVFVSYYYDQDNHYKNLLLAWNANDQFDLRFEDVSTDISINSTNRSYIRRRIAAAIEESDVVLVIIGNMTHRSDWVAWEIEKAVDSGKKIVAVKRSKRDKSPPELLSVGAVWVDGFNEREIADAIGV